MALHHAAEDTAADTACSLPSRDQSQSPAEPPLPPDAWLLPSTARDQSPHHQHPPEAHTHAPFWAEAQCRHPKLCGLSDQRADHSTGGSRPTEDSRNGSLAPIQGHSEEAVRALQAGTGGQDEAAADREDAGERTCKEDVSRGPPVLRGHSWFLGLGGDSSDTAAGVQVGARG